MHSGVTAEYPFLTVAQAAFFLQVSVETARWMYDRGDLPRAVRLDGGLFEPTPGKHLIPYFEFRELLSGQRGVFSSCGRPERSTSCRPSRARAQPARSPTSSMEATVAMTVEVIVIPAETGAAPTSFFLHPAGGSK